MSKTARLSTENAEALGAEAFAFLTADPARLLAFLEASGFGIADIKQRAGTREFLTFVLDYLVRDESQLLIFASETGAKPDQVMLAYHVLSGDIAS